MWRLGSEVFSKDSLIQRLRSGVFVKDSLMLRLRSEVIIKDYLMWRLLSGFFVKDSWMSRPGSGIFDMKALISVLCYGVKDPICAVLCFLLNEVFLEGKAVVGPIKGGEGKRGLNEGLVLKWEH